jgi:flagellar motor switch protein FliG
MAKAETKGVTELTGKQKAAILVIALGQMASIRLLKELSEEEIESITMEIANFRNVTPEIQETVFEEFYDMLMARSYLATGGMDYARQLLTEAVGAVKSDEILGKLSTFLRVAPFDFLKRTDKEQLLSFIQNEHPQTIALILAFMEPQDAAKVIGGLPADVQPEVAQRLAKMDRTSPEVIREVERVIEQKVSAVVSTELSSAGGIPDLVSVLNFVDRSTEKSIMEALEDRDPELADEVKRMMFVFEDIRQLDDRTVQKVLQEIPDKKDLSIALRGVSDEVKDKILRNMSKRAAATLQEDMDFMGPMRLKDVEDAQQRIVEVIRKLEEAGDIIIERGGQTQFV